MENRTKESIGNIFTLIPVALVAGYTLSKMYFWFVMPLLKCPAINPVQMGGLWIIYFTINSFAMKSKGELQSDETKSKGYESAAIRFFICLFTYSFALGMSYLYHILFF